MERKPFDKSRPKDNEESFEKLASPGDVKRIEKTEAGDRRDRQAKEEGEKGKDSEGDSRIRKSRGG